MIPFLESVEMRWLSWSHWCRHQVTRFQLTPNSRRRQIRNFVLTEQLEPRTLLTNVAPVVVDQSFFIQSTIGKDAVVGTVGVTDPDGPSETFKITSGDSGAFALDPATGTITVKDLVALAQQKSPVLLTITVTDTGSPVGSDTAVITINVNHPPVFTATDFKFIGNAGGVLGTATALDPDSGQTLFYSIDSGNSAGIFQLDSATGQLKIANQSAFSALTFPAVLGISVHDSVNPAVIDTAKITISANTAPVVTDQQFSIPSTSPVGSLVGAVAATDADPGQSLTYQITAGNSGAFQIEAATGKITVADIALLAKQIAPAVLTIQVVDNGIPATASSATVTVNVNHPPVFASDTFDFPGKVTNDRVLGIVLASDVDPGQTLTYSIVSGNQSGAFELEPSTGKLKILDVDKFNALTLPTSLVINVSDSEKPPGIDTAIVKILKVDTTTPGAPIHFNAQSFTVSPLVQNDVIGTVFAYSDDSTTSLTYAFKDATESRFAIDSKTGVLTAKTDLKTAGQVTVPITVTDASHSQTSVTRSIVVNIVTTNNHLPISQNLDFTLSENTPGGTVVGNVIADSADSGQSLTYSIAESSIPRALSINSKTGEITVVNDSLLDFEKNPVFHLRVEIRDDGKGVAIAANTKSKPLSTFISVTIRLIDVLNEPFTFQVSGNSRTFRVGSEPVRIDPKAIFRLGSKIPADTSFKSTELTVSVTPGEFAEAKKDRSNGDRLVIVSDQAGPGRIRFSGKSILYDNTVIGTFVPSTGKNHNLVISFNESATTASIQELLRRVGFKTSGSAGQRNVKLEFTGISATLVPDDLTESQVVDVVR